MTREIRKAAVLGSGTMGSGIAALLASVGVEVALLDIPEKGTTPADPPEGRSAPALAGLERARATKAPAPLTDEEIARIRIGNFDDHLGWLADVDWVVEVVVERLDIKRVLLERVVAAANPDAILSTNTSGIPIAAISEGFPPEVARRFLGTHFFNPPRVLKLLEIIPGAGTDPEILGFLSDYATNVLGKGVVPCKDTPNFIGNRIGLHPVWVLFAVLAGAELAGITGVFLAVPVAAVAGVVVRWAMRRYLGSQFYRGSDELGPPPV